MSKTMKLKLEETCTCLSLEFPSQHICSGCSSYGSDLALKPKKKRNKKQACFQYWMPEANRGQKVREHKAACNVLMSKGYDMGFLHQSSTPPPPSSEIARSSTPPPFSSEHDITRPAIAAPNKPVASYNTRVTGESTNTYHTPQISKGVDNYFLPDANVNLREERGKVLFQSPKEQVNHYWLSNDARNFVNPKEEDDFCPLKALHRYIVLLMDAGKSTNVISE